MKIRKGFVSNSSSSSFTCEVCGENCSGWDMGLEDVEMHECGNGHLICDTHMLGEIDAQAQKEFMLSYGVDDSEREQLKTMDDDEIEEMFEGGDYCYYIREEMPTSFCPICSFKDIDPAEAVKYLIKKNGLTMETLKAQIQEEFKDYDAFMDFNKEKEDEI